MSEAVSPALDDIRDARPLVAGSTGNRSVWVFAGIAAVGAAVLFASLEVRRSEQKSDPLLPVQVQGEGMIVPPPPLAIPDLSKGDASSLALAPPQPLPSHLPSSALSVPMQPSRPVPQASAPIYAPPAPLGPPYIVPSPQPSGPATVYQAPAAPPTASEPSADGNQRVIAGRFTNPSLTIPQGAVIQAVLETAVDSTRPGPARAIVSRDVRSFDGTRVLVPRGSRLYGEYKADVSSGQNRAMIQWTRLMRPDGVVIALDSPSADPLGRAGVKGKVNSHFFTRFGNALLQTLLNVGVSYGTSQATGGTVIVGLPGAAAAAPLPQADNVRPTLKVAQGTPVSVFVARDLDFSEVER